MNLFLVMAGGALGAGARHLASRAALAIAGPGLPVGTLAINVTGGLLMGMLAGLLARTTAGEPWRLFLGVGVLGGFTTFSAFSLDAVLLAERGQWVAAVGYVLASVVGSIAALVAGLALARTLTGAAA
jgi:CrcB protein